MFDLPGRLNGKLVINISNGESLTINCANGYSPFLLRNSGQLGNVTCRLKIKLIFIFYYGIIELSYLNTHSAIKIVLKFVVQRSDTFAKSLELWNDQVVSEYLADE